MFTLLKCTVTLGVTRTTPFSVQSHGLSTPSTQLKQQWLTVQRVQGLTMQLDLLCSTILLEGSAIISRINMSNMANMADLTIVEEEESVDLLPMMFICSTRTMNSGTDVDTHQHHKLQG